MAQTLSGQFTITTAGTAVKGPDVPGAVFVRALAGNTGKVYVGNDGADDVTALNGYELSPGDALPFVVENLNQFWFDSATNGDKFCWVRAG
jgi:hypothetical protein